MSSVEATWRLIGCSSLISTAGTLVIYADLVWNSVFHRKISILKSRTFMVASLAISSGVLLTTALHSLTANALKYFRKGDLSPKQASQLLLASITTGIVICTVVNFLIHLATSKSIVHCAHGGAHGDEHEHVHGDTHAHAHGHAHAHAHAHAHGHAHAHAHAHSPVHSPAHSPAHSHSPSPLRGHSRGHSPSAEEPLLNRPVRQYVSIENFHAATTQSKSSLIDKLQNNQQPAGECRGFESIYHCAAEIALVPEGDTSLLEFEPQSNYVAAGDEPHHHHVIPRGSEMLSIGLQTAFAITVHKFPEGFLIYATQRKDKQVGLSVFFALAIHNFFEGFTIAVPLYLALGSRFKAVLYAAILSAGSQPLGALLAHFFMRDHPQKMNYPEFGLLIGVTAGFMIIIGLQMLTTAVSYGGLPHKTIFWAVVGILLVLLSKCV